MFSRLFEIEFLGTETSKDQDGESIDELDQAMNGLNKLGRSMDWKIVW